MKKIAYFGIVLAIVLSSVALFAPAKVSNLGGLIHTLQEDFTAGIRVGGTEVISKARALTATSLTVSGTSLMGSVTAGAYNYRGVVTPTTDTTLTVAQSGAIFNMGTAGLDLALPAPTAANGVHYRFVVSAAFATTNMTIVAGTADTIEGSLIVAGAVVDCTANDLITIVATSEDLGDFVDLYSNGTYWMIGANQTLAASNTTCTG